MQTCYQANVIANCGCGDATVIFRQDAVFYLNTNASINSNNIGACTSSEEVECVEDIEDDFKVDRP